MTNACVCEHKTNKICFFFVKVATPKQIRELMKVDGLTNDEVKSHLQVNYNLINLPFMIITR
jgi:hypothetical protein